MAAYTADYKKLNALKAELAKTVQADEAAAKERDYLQYQLEQLQSLKLRSGEIRELEDEQNLLTHAEEIAQGLDYCANLLTADNGPLEGGIVAGVKSMASALSRLTEQYRAKSQRESAPWKESGGRYIPHPAKWLSHRRWEDAAPTAQAPAKSYSMPAWAQQTSRPFDPAAAVDILARHRPRRLKRLEA